MLLVSIFFWHLRFPKIMVTKASIQNLLYFLLLLPPVIGILGCCARTLENAFWSRFCTRLSGPVLFLGILSALVLLVLPPYCSSTTKPRQYLVLDTDVKPSIEEDIRALFPEGLKDATGKADYQYYKYTSLYENALYITLGETLNAEDYEKEAARLESLSLFASSNVSDSENLTRLDTVTADGLRLHATLDATCHRILYSASAR